MDFQGKGFPAAKALVWEFSSRDCQAEVLLNYDDLSTTVRGFRAYCVGRGIRGRRLRQGGARGPKGVRLSLEPFSKLVVGERTIIHDKSERLENAFTFGKGVIMSPQSMKSTL